MKTTLPTPKKEDKLLKIHGDTRVDPYYWLNNRENPEVISYLEEENKYSQSVLKSTKKFQKELFDEMKGRIKEDDSSVPYLLNGYWYITRYEKGKEYPIYTRKFMSLDSEEEIMLDVNEMAKDYEYYKVAPGNIISVVRNSSNGSLFLNLASYSSSLVKRSLSSTTTNQTVSLEVTTSSTDTYIWYMVPEDGALMLTGSV